MALQSTRRKIGSGSAQMQCASVRYAAATMIHLHIMILSHFGNSWKRRKRNYHSSLGLQPYSMIDNRSMVYSTWAGLICRRCCRCQWQRRQARQFNWPAHFLFPERANVSCMLPELTAGTAAVLVINATAFSSLLIMGQQCKRKSDLNTVIDLPKVIRIIP